MEVTARAIIIEDKGLMVFYRERLVNGKRLIYYALPGGHVENGETSQEAVVRELMEELGIEIKIKEKLGEQVVDGRFEQYFLCERVAGEPILGGEELLINNSDNYYEFMYLPVDKINDVDIRAKDLIKKVVG